MGLNWMSNDYFHHLISRDKRSHTALEMLVDDLHVDKQRTLTKFLCHSGSEDFLWGLVKLLGHSNSRVAGNSAYILGTLAESDMGCQRVINLTGGRGDGSRKILADLTKMLTFDDSESVMNAAGTMGTLAESYEGREWMLKEPGLDMTIQHITDLLNNDNLWTASNAALVLARLTIAEEGCHKLLGHSRSEVILTRLIASLGVDEAGRGMNAAFAIGRMCDMESGRNRLLTLPESERMISSLAKMLSCSDPGASKNACFALSCLATNREGHGRLLRNIHAEEVLKTLAELLSADDSETGWFAAMTLRTLASQPKGCLRLREHPTVTTALKGVESRASISDDLREEISQTLQILKKLEKPSPPKVEVSGPAEIQIEWEEVTTKSGFTVKYQLFEGNKVAYFGRDLKYTCRNMEPHTQYTFKLRTHTEGDDSPLSDPVMVHTEEDVPSPPLNVRILGCTTTQLKVGWEAPQFPNGALKGYYVYNGDKLHENTTDHSSILSGLQPSTSYDISVCAATSKGKGPKETATGVTAEMGAHAPSKPDVQVRGRNEMHVSWKPPEVPLGRISRYDVIMNGDVIFGGTELHTVARRLKPDHDYTFVVCAITNEGRCESKPTKKRTAKDEFDGDRTPLYKKPVKKEDDKKEDQPPPPKPKKRKSVTTLSPDEKPKSRSASAHSTKSSRNKTPSHPVTPVVDKSRPTSPQKREPLQATAPVEITDKKESPEKPKSQLVAQVSAWEFSLRSYSSDELSRPGSQSSKCRSLKEEPLYHPNIVHSTDNIEPPQQNTKPSRHKTLPKPKPPHVKTNKSRYSYNRQQTDIGPQISSVRNPELGPHQDRTHRHIDSGVSHDNRRRVAHGGESHDTRKSGSYGDVDSDSKQSSDDKSRGKTRDVDGAVNSSAGGSKSHGALNSSAGGGKSHRSGSIKSSSEYLDTSDPSSGRDENQEGDLMWQAQASQALQQPRQYNKPDGITRMFSTLNASTYRPSMSQRQHTSIMEFDAPLPLAPRNQGAPPSYVQRANTFMASHRVLRSPKPGVGRRSMPGYPNNHNQWQPDFPSPKQTPARNANKFVPMQFRTQPANLPGTLPKQNVSLVVEKGNPLQPGDGSSRSRSDLLDDQQSAGYAMPSQRNSTERISSPDSTTGHSGVRKSRHHHAVMTSLAVSNNTSQENTLQSAR